MEVLRYSSPLGWSTIPILSSLLVKLPNITGIHFQPNEGITAPEEHGLRQ
jgi:hypothetical protein